MNLTNYDRLMDAICTMKRTADKLRRDADILEVRLYAALRIRHIAREPGFPCWTHNNLPDYYNTPREVAEALDKRPTPGAPIMEGHA